MEATISEHRDILNFMKIGAIGRSYKASLLHLEKAKEIIQLNTALQQD